MNDFRPMRRFKQQLSDEDARDVLRGAKRDWARCFNGECIPRFGSPMGRSIGERR